MNASVHCGYDNGTTGTHSSPSTSRPFRVAQLPGTSLKHQLPRSSVDIQINMHAPPYDRRSNFHPHRHSTPIDMPSPHKRKGSATALHQLLRINTHNLHLAAQPVVNLTRLDSPSLASFTSYSESIDSHGPASGSLRGHIHVRSQSLFTMPKKEDIPDKGNGISGINMPQSLQRPRLFSLFEFSPTVVSRPASPIVLDVAGSPYSISSTSPSSPSMSIPSISRTHSTAASSSIPGTPPLPLPLPPLSARQKKRSRRAMSGYEGRKRAPSLPMPPAYRSLDLSPSHNRARERAFSASDRSNTRFDPRITTRSPSPGYTSNTPRSNSPCSPQSLAALETSSKFMRAVATCAVCGMSGPDYPRCPGCGDAWCSRACRMTARREAGGAGGEGIRGHGCKGKQAVRR